MTEIIELDGKKYRIVPVEDKPEPEPPKPRRTGYERAESGGSFWITGTSGGAYELRDDFERFEDKIYESGNYVTDETLAKNRARRDRLLWNMERWAVEHRRKRIYWGEENTSKYSIYYDHFSEKFYVERNSVFQTFEVIYFDTEMVARAAIEEFKDELTWYFTEYRDCVWEGSADD